ncbi:T9SS type B sorting domain-containing protein [Chitinophaga sp. Mgbs1]|uniref:T9SS type B sorting domain-containing protein n=1 Tax=Chitinophaga solisilvae TaxID=1233460 RepID=A0A9Q5DE53_9BACT|nr:T9SS type B sorting domain-containing protein [Chitinophaga solisilvae]
MRNYTLSFLYRSTWLTALLLILVCRLSAQVNISIGSATSGNSDIGYPCPLQDYYEGNRAQYLYTAAELTAAGMGPGAVSGLKFFVKNLNGAGLIEQYSIRIGTTTTASLSDNSWENAPNVVFAPADYTPVAGTNSFTLASPLFWNGTDNIVVEVCSGSPTSSGTTFYTKNVEVPYTTGLSFNGSHTYRADDEDNLCGTAETENTGSMTTRPDITFVWTLASACTGTPTAGTVTSSASTVCLNASFTLKLTGTTLASGLTYQWQASTTPGTWTNISGATTNQLTTSQAATTTYRCVVTCTGSSQSANSTTVTVTSPTLAGGTFFIDRLHPTAPNTFGSFNDAYNFMKCGINAPIVFNVVAGSGPYIEQLNMQPVPGASAANTITFNGNGDTLRFTGTSGNRAVIQLNDADYITFSNLVIKATGTGSSGYGWGVGLTNDADYNAVKNCTIIVDSTSSSSSAYAGIVISSSVTSPTTTGSAKCDFNTFDGNKIIGGYYGIVMTGSNTMANGNNRIINNTISEFYNYGVYALGSFNTLIENNHISRPARFNAGAFYGIYFSDLNTKANITRNRISNPFGGVTSSTSSAYGIYFTSTDALVQLENIVSNNVIYNFTGKGDAYGIYNSSSDNVWYFHNTIVMDGSSTNSATYTTRGFYQTTKADGIEFLNNLISVTRGGGGSKYAVYFSATNGTIHANRNLYFLSAPGGTSYTGYYTANRATLLDWQTASSQDTASLASNPLFVAPASGNYQPANASIDNKGIPRGITVDVNNAVRSTATPDIGAYEFTPGPCVTPPVAGAATVSNTPVCVNRKVALSLINNSIGLGQTYQWQSASVAAGPYTNLGNVLSNPDTVITSAATRYYRVAVTCSGNTSYSDPVLLTVNPAFPGGNHYTINKNQPASASNFVSFNAAKAAMECGIAGPVVFNVVAGSGPYIEQLVLDSIAGTSAVNTITFKGNGDTIRFKPVDDNERAVIKLRSADYITFDSLVIDVTQATSNGYGVQLLSNADSNRIINSQILVNTTSTGSSYAGVVINGSENYAASGDNNNCDGNIVRNNKITGGYYGVLVYGNGTNNTVAGNSIRDFYYYGVYLYGNTNALIDHNDIARPARTSVSYSTYAISVGSKSDGVIISGNRMHNMFGGALTSTNSFYGIEHSYADATAANPSKVINNTIYDIVSAGDVRGLSNYSSDNVVYYHNTVALNDSKSTSDVDLTGLFQSGTVAGVAFFNNILDISRTGPGYRYGLEINGTDGFQSDYNNIYVKGVANRTFTGSEATDYITLADWRAGTKLDSNSTAIQPVYADLAAGNLAQVISPLDNTGKGKGVTVDILGTARNANTPDVGAYEVTIPDCTAPVVPGTATVDPGTLICMGTAIKLDLTGNSKGGKQTYQWQHAGSPTGPWKYISSPQFTSVFNTTAGPLKYYRCAVVCNGGDTAYSAPVAVNLNPPLLKGTYSINPAQPSTATNFQSFTAAVAKLECGIAGAVVFEAESGTYTEQIVMHHIPGASDTSRVTFTSRTGVAANVTLGYKGTSARNYVLKLDSVDYVTWNKITIKPLDTVYARGVEFANRSSYDSLHQAAVVLPATLRTGVNLSGVYAERCLGVANVISGNTISNGTYGVYWSNDYGNDMSPGVTIDSNTIQQPHDYGIYADYVNNLRIRKNKVTLSGPLASTAYGIYTDNSDSSFTVSRNRIYASNTAQRVYGIYNTASEPVSSAPGQVNGNEVYLRGGLTGDLRGITISSSENINIVNNVISIQTSAGNSYGFYTEYSGPLNINNNSILNSSTGTSNNYAGYLAASSIYGVLKVRNNIFASDTSGRALYIGDPNYLNSDYNTLYTKGTVLVRQGTPATSYANFEAYRTGSSVDGSSIVYKPAFVSASDLQPAIADPEVWAIHGRGVQVPGNDKDINGNPRPTILKDGVPDMGAYEFLPTSTPPVLPAFPAAPAAGITQTFMFGTDTVTKITWNGTTTLPTDLTVRRYSGVKPPNVAAGTDFMYFYTDVDATPAGSVYNFNINQYYVDSWQGYIKRQKEIRLARTDSTNKWITDSLSRVDDAKNVIIDSSLHYLDKFTGLNGGNNGPQLLQPADSSNRGTRFWVGYGHHQFFGTTNMQNMVLYLNAKDSANVVVKINGTGWERTYRIPANKTITTEIMPKVGVNDSRLLDEGWSDRGISIESDVPIVAYAHIYGNTSSGATMLLPVGTYGYDYYALTSRQYYQTNTYSWFYVVADYDNTTVEITPSVPTLAGKPANQTFTVTLNKGEVYQVLGALLPGSFGEGYDLSGSHVKSIVNGDGKCYPVAVFSGSSRTGIGCGGAAGTGSGDNLIQQNFPSQAWGKKYLTAPTSNADDATLLMGNIYRVLVKDTATKVKVNGTLLTGLINKRFYQYESQTADYIESDQPVMVAQYMSSSGECENTDGDGDPEMIYISPLEQGIKQVGLYRNTVEVINVNYLTLIIPTAGVGSLRIDGSNVFDYTYVHPHMPGYSVVVKRWEAASAQCNVSSDSAFTAITYGLGGFESYGYNAGTLVKNLNILPSFSNVMNPNGNNNTYTCAKTPFRFSMMVPVKPTKLIWKLSQVKNLTPNADVSQDNPVPVDSVIANERKYYRFVLQGDYVFSAPGNYNVPILISHPDIESCSNSFESVLTVKVIPAPVVDFTTLFSGCVNDPAQFKGSATTSNNVGISKWNWNFGDTTSSAAKDTVKQFKYPGIHRVKLSIVAAEGCIGDTTKEVEVYAPGIASLVKDSMTVCAGSDVTLSAKNPQAGVLYNWYDAPTGGNLLFTGNDYTIRAIAAGGTWYLEAVTHGCPGEVRARAVVHVLPVLTTPVVKVDTVGVNLIRFSWKAVPNATEYEVSIDGGRTWMAPSSGRQGLVHLVAGLQPQQAVKLIVKVKGCEEKISDPAEGKTLPDGIYIPNTFTPNGDAKNDMLKVYGYIINKIHMAIFDQWGEKVFETNSQEPGWDGTYKGKPLPSGVYIYVCHLVLKDGSTVEKKGVINLIR